ncbi:hypothetical protein ONZ45_g10338 [Pleurotus djamor]|nr:hypothetical protein ONZ45_g10338 [Pleurotus djamor]
MTANQITLYTNKASPFGHYVEIALLEAKLPFTRYEIDVKNKPEWFPSLNHIGKIPVITYGGPPTPPDKPSSESHKLAESVALLEFINELAPEAQLLGKDVIERAKARFCIQFMVTSFAKTMFDALLRKGAMSDVLKVLKQLQDFLPSEKDEGSFVLGEKFSLADAVIAAFVLRANNFFGNDFGSYPEGEGLKLYEELQTSPEFARYRAYIKTLKTRSSVVDTYPEEYHIQVVGKGGLSRFR